MRNCLASAPLNAPRSPKIGPFTSFFKAEELPDLSKHYSFAAEVLKKDRNGTTGDFVMSCTYIYIHIPATCFRPDTIGNFGCQRLGRTLGDI